MKVNVNDRHFLPTPSASASVEQVFSISGRIACEARASLNSRHQNELVCLHQWLVDAGMVSKEAIGRSEKRAKGTKKFAYLNVFVERSRAQMRRKVTMRRVMEQKMT